MTKAEYIEIELARLYMRRSHFISDNKQGSAQAIAVDGEIRVLESFQKALDDE